MLSKTTSLLISIIIPCYNAARWIRSTLQSVFLQQDVKFEVIVVDDGSSDDSAAIVASDFPLVRLIRISNSGPARARNIGWKHSRGAWIQFLDADDLLHPAKLATQLAVATQCTSDVAVVYSDWQRLVYRDGKWQQSGVRCQPDPYINAIEDILLTENFIATGSQLFRRTWLEAVCGFDERHWLIEDVDLLLRIAMLVDDFITFLLRNLSFFTVNTPPLFRVAINEHSLMVVYVMRVWWKIICARRVH